MNSLEISYYLLQEIYMKKYGINKTDDLLKYKNYFPDDWFKNYSVEIKVKYLSFALKNSLTLVEVEKKFNEKKF